MLEALELPHGEMVWTYISLANRLTELLGVRSVKVVAGNCDENQATKNLLGMAAAKEFVSGLGHGTTVAVTGGSTVASIPNYINKMNNSKDLLFIAAQGRRW